MCREKVDGEFDFLSWALARELVFLKIIDVEIGPEGGVRSKIGP